MGILLIVSGPSGAGKGTLVKRLLEKEPNLELSVSCTTRLPRKGECDGKDYFFLRREEFERRIRANDFLEYDEHFGNYYGTPKSFVLNRLQTKSVLLEIDVVGALNVARTLREEGERPPVTVMVVPPDAEELRRRLKERGTESDEEIALRMERVRYELTKRDEYDYVLVNDELKCAVDELRGIFEREVLRAARTE